jgi:hypothetical protein
MRWVQALRRTISSLVYITDISQAFHLSCSTSHDHDRQRHSAATPSFDIASHTDTSFNMTTKPTATNAPSNNQGQLQGQSQGWTPQPGQPPSLPPTVPPNTPPRRSHSRGNCDTQLRPTRSTLQPISSTQSTSIKATTNTIGNNQSQLQGQSQGRTVETPSLPQPVPGSHSRGNSDIRLRPIRSILHPISTQSINMNATTSATNTAGNSHGRTLPPPAPQPPNSPVPESVRRFLSERDDPWSVEKLNAKR